MKRYDEYIEINSPWIKNIPMNWNAKRLKSVAAYISRGETPVYTDDTSCTKVINQATFSQGYWNTKKVRYTSSSPIGNESVPKQRDILLASTGRGVLGKVFYFDQSDTYIADGHVTIIRTCKTLNSRFLYYYLSVHFDTINGLLARGSTNQTELQEYPLKNMPVPLPSADEQDQIVRYLDWQVSKINRLIAAKRKQIALLKEHRTAKINQAVTTGIHSDTQLAYTGYNWLPYAPANWKPVPAKALFRNITELRRLDDSMLAATQKYGLIEQTEYMRLEGRRIVLANDNLDKWLHTEPNDFIISLRSFQGGLEMCSKPGCVTWHYVVLRSRRNIYPDFYKWFFKSAAYIGALQKTSDFIRDGQDLRFSNFVKVGLFIIPMDEQREIAEYLNREIPKYDVAISNLEKQIDQITELRTRLISDVVTGRVDVRGIEVPEFEMVRDTVEEQEEDAEEIMQET